MVSSSGSVRAILRLKLIIFWFGEVLIPAVSGVVFAAAMSLIAYAVDGSLPPAGRAFLAFSLWFGGFFLLSCGGIPAKLHVWRQFRRLSRERKTWETARAMLRTERAERKKIWKERLDTTLGRR